MEIKILMVYLLDVEGVMIFLKKNNEPHKMGDMPKKMTTKPQPKSVEKQALSSRDGTYFMLTLCNDSTQQVNSRKSTK